MIQEEFNKIVENLAKYNDDYKIVVEDVDLDSYDPKNQPKNIRAA